MSVATANAIGKKLSVVYVTSSQFKRAENEVFIEHCTLDDVRIGDQFEFRLRDNRIQEELVADIRTMVEAEVRKAYAQVRVPCIVEHAGLVFEEYAARWYPGGLTKPMWNVLQEKFVNETNSTGRRAVARAVVAYCDGQKVSTFMGETPGHIAKKPVGRREFYWDTVFIPDDPNGKPGKKTYAQICDDPKLGLPYKMKELSQSTKAMIEFLRYLKANPQPGLWAN
jgi:inosine/xanthosine triphosphate pyrophosphatase family protein